MPILIANINILTALGITNKELFDAVFESFDDFDAFCHNSGYDYEFDDNDNLVIITPKSLKINTGIEIPQGPERQKPDKNYFCITALENGTVTINIPSNINDSLATSISYSKDGTTWTDTLVNSTLQTITIPVVADENVYLKGIAKQWSSSADYYTNINCSGNVNVSGNVLSLLYGDNFENQTQLPTGSTFTFARLFLNNTHIVDASQLILNTSTLTLTDLCYHSMFSGCTSLTTAPELPATNLANYCYRNMFEFCTSLTTAPALPATTLALYCYGFMFRGCTSLTTAPELPATTLTSYCYEAMFRDCGNLNYIKAMFITTSLIPYTAYWVYGVAATGTYVKNALASYTTTGINGIPIGWAVETADS